MINQILESINGTSLNAVAYDKAYKAYSNELSKSLMDAIGLYPEVSNVSKSNIKAEFYKNGDYEKPIFLKIKKLSVLNGKLFVECSNNSICIFDDLYIEVKLLIRDSIRRNLNKII